MYAPVCYTHINRCTLAVAATAHAVVIFPGSSVLFWCCFHSNCQNSTAAGHTKHSLNRFTAMPKHFSCLLSFPFMPFLLLFILLCVSVSVCLSEFEFGCNGSLLSLSLLPMLLQLLFIFGWKFIILDSIQNSNRNRIKKQIHTYRQTNVLHSVNRNQAMEFVFGVIGTFFRNVLWWSR